MKRITRRILSHFCIFDGVIPSLLFWELVAVLSVLIVHDAQFVFGDEQIFISTLCKGIKVPLMFIPQSGRCYPLTHWDCNFIYCLPRALVGNIPRILYAFNAITFVVTTYCVAAVLRADNGLMRSRAAIWIDFCLLLVFLATPSCYQMFWWNIFPEARMLVLTSVALMFFLRGHQKNSPLSVWLAALALVLTLGYKETSFVLLIVFSGSVCLLGWRQVSRSCRMAMVFCLLIGVLYIFFYGLVVRGQVVNSYAEGRQVGMLAAAYYYFENPLMCAALLLAVVRGVVVFRRTPNAHFIYDAMLFSGICFAFAYVALGMTQEYYVVPAYVFILPPIGHWVKVFAARYQKVWCIAICALILPLYGWMKTAISDYSLRLIARRTDVRQMQALAANRTIERVWYVYHEKGLFPDYWLKVFNIFYQYAGGDLSKVVCVDEVRSIGAHEVAVLPFPIGHKILPMEDSLINVATYVCRSDWYAVLYGPAADCLLACNKYRVIYDTDGGVMAGACEDAVALDQWFCVMAPTRKGYVFEGWTVDGDLNPDKAMVSVVVGEQVCVEGSSCLCGGGYSSCGFNNLSAPGGSVTLRAHWRRLR